jgi:hypothetical protein
MQPRPPFAAQRHIAGQHHGPGKTMSQTQHVPGKTMSRGIHPLSESKALEDAQRLAARHAPHSDREDGTCDRGQLHAISSPTHKTASPQRSVPSASLAPHVEKADMAGNVNQKNAAGRLRARHPRAGCNCWPKPRPLTLMQTPRSTCTHNC